jgi:5-methylcytosine-specific restriction endonuclease McrBC GTP-binding regulatory subunit McrB
MLRDAQHILAEHNEMPSVPTLPTISNLIEHALPLENNSNEDCQLISSHLPHLKTNIFLQLAEQSAEQIMETNRKFEFFLQERAFFTQLRENEEVEYPLNESDEQ